MMRSSGTPCSFSTSTALIADPPVAAHPSQRAHRVMPASGLTEHRVQQEHIPLCDILRELLGAAREPIHSLGTRTVLSRPPHL